MKFSFLSILVFSAFCLGLYLGTNMTERTMKNTCESRVVTAHMEKKPFIIMNGEPMIIRATIKPDGSARYRAELAGR